MEISGEHSVAAAPVNVQHDPGQLRHVPVQRVDEGRGLRSEPARRNDTDDRVLRLPCSAAKNVSDRALARRLVVGGDGLLLHESDDGRRRPFAQLVLDQAAVVAGGVGSEELFQLGATVEGRCFDCGQ